MWYHPSVILPQSLDRYLATTVPDADPLLAEMRAHGARDRIPIVVPETGILLEVLTAACGARTVVEVGTAIGVSTLHIARSLPPGGRVISFEIDPGRHAAATGYLDRAGLSDRVDLRLTDAAEGLAALSETVDMAFLDGLKHDYPHHLELVLAQLRPGGLVVIDNMLMDGEVVESAPPGRWGAEQVGRMRAFTAALVAHPALRATVLAVGDGVAVGVRTA